MRYVILLILTCSAQAFACPQLTGSYSCQSQDGSSDAVALAQSEANGVTTYTYNGSNILTDDRANPIPDSKNIKNATFRAWCTDDATMNTQLIGTDYNNGTPFGSIALSMAFSIASGTLQISTTGQIVNSAGSFPINQISVCTKDPGS